jgi:UDP-N-acetyl-D-mannosaminuronate dehydrogenase
LQAKTFTKKMLTLSAAEIVGQNRKKGAIVVLESTIYPGVTEEIIAPILDLENES